MSISFSGLASGLDTSSWVESLTALKRAKVTTYQKEQAALSVSKNALADIKSYFSTFRSMLEKITDAKFGVTSMDLFSQNLATSSNPGALTASATSDANEGVYNIVIDKLATNTQAVSNYKTTETVIETNIATKDTFLKDVGVNAGDIAVTVGGVEQTVTLDNNETIGSLISKLNTYGVDASYNETTGIFAVDLDSTKMRDISGTNLITAFHLQDVNRGYKTSNITRKETSTVTSNAETTTKLSELGLNANTNVTLTVEGTTVTVTANKTDTLAGLITKLENKGIQADLSDGIFTIHNAEILNPSSNALATALGLEATVSNQTQKSGNLSYDTTITTTTYADGTTKLSSVGISGTTFTYTNLDGAGTVTVGSTATINDLIAAFDAKGVRAEIVDGEFKVYGVSALDSKLTAKLTDHSEVYEVKTTSGVLKYTTTTYTTTQATGTSKLSALGYTASASLTFDGVAGSIAINGNTTVNSLISSLAAKGISAKIENGVFEIDGSAKLANTTANNTFKAAIGLEEEVATQTQASGYLTYQTLVTTTSAATLATKLNDLNEGLPASNGQTIIFKNNANQTKTISLTSTSTLGDIRTAMVNAGASVTQRADGGLYITGAEITGGTYDVISALHLTASSSTGSITYTGSALTYDTVNTETKNADNNTKLSDLGITSGQYSVIQNGVRKTAYISEGDTLADLRQTLQGYGIQAALTTNASGSRLTLYAESDSYVETSSASGASNVVSTLFSSGKTTTYNYEASPEIVTSTTSTVNASGSELVTRFGISAGAYDVYQDGVKKTLYISSSMTFSDLSSTLAGFGINASLVDTGSGVKLVCSGSGNTYINATFAGTKTQTNNYDGVLSYTTTHTETVNPNNDSLMSDYGVTSGQYYIYNNGVKYTANIGIGDTFGDFRETLRSFGVQASFVQENDGVHLVLNGTGDSYVARSTASAASNVAETLFPTKTTEYNYNAHLQTTATATATITATSTDLISDYTSTPIAGKLNVVVDGNTSTLNVAANETFSSLMEKFGRLGIEASLSEEGKLVLQAGEHTISVTKAASEGSDLLTAIGLTYSSNLGGYSASSTAINSSIEVTRDLTYSASNYAGYSTKMSMLNISNGTLSIYRDGVKSTVTIDKDETFAQLRTRVNNAFGQGDIDITFEDGYLKFYSTNDSVRVEVGASVDSSNISTICGLVSDGNASKSSRELYCLNGTSKITDSGLFRRGNVNAGTFTIGNAIFTIDNNTTLNSLIGQINSSEDSKATAYWDSVDGKLVINSRISGSSYINIEAGTSNFTDVLGLTTSTWNGNGTVNTTKLEGSSQSVGDSASFSINGTNFTSTTNLVGSDITKLNGVTLNLRNLTPGEAITLTIERDTETLSNAISDIVDAYNELITNVDAELAKTGNLSNQSGLKMLRNQIRSYMMNSLGSAGLSFSNLNSIGISTSAASASNISTNNIDTLSFDKTAFSNAFKADRDAVRALLVGNDSAQGVFSKVESTVENSLMSVSGFFASAENSYNSKIQKLNDKIDKQNTYVTRYQARLQSKFQAMESIISKIQQQYQSFLGG